MLASPTMPRFRLAHFSDIHYTESPLADPRRSLHGKRLASFFSYFLGGRRERFLDGPRRIATLLDDVDSAGVDHAVCTGDLTAASLEAEFAGLAGVFGPRLERPDRYTVLPGNHDRYVPSAVQKRHFERYFEPLCPGATQGFPFSKTLAPGVRLVAIDPSRPTGFVSAAGLCGKEQLEAFERLLSEDTESTTIVALHYGLLRWNGVPDRERHRLLDYEAVLSVRDASPARIALGVHGHMHGAFTVASAKRTIVCAGSSIDLLVDCGYFVYDIDLDTHAISVERRHWDRHSHRFTSLECHAFEEAMRQRRGFRLPHQVLLT